MGLFGKSFDQKVEEAAAAVRGAVPEVRDLRAMVSGKVVTLEGKAENLEAKGRAMAEFNRRISADNVINRIQVMEAAPAPPIPGPVPGPAPADEVSVYEVKPGDTLGAIAQRFYGKASLFPKIFEANRDILSTPDLIKVGQKLKIPK